MNEAFVLAMGSDIDEIGQTYLNQVANAFTSQDFSAMSSSELASAFEEELDKFAELVSDYRDGGQAKVDMQKKLARNIVASVLPDSDAMQEAIIGSIKDPVFGSFAEMVDRYISYLGKEETESRLSEL